MIWLLVLVAVVVAAVVFGLVQSRKPAKEAPVHTIVLHQFPSDSPGYTRIVVRDPIGQTQAGAFVTARYGNGQSHELLLHGQKEFDVPTGSLVTFADGIELQTDPA